MTSTMLNCPVRNQHTGAAEGGFTIVEAMIAILLTSLVVGLAYASYEFLSRIAFRWKGQMALENAVHLTARDLTRRAFRAAEVRRGKGSWTFETRDGTETTYRLRGESLFRNGKPMHGRQVHVVNLSIEVMRSSPSSGRNGAFGHSGTGRDGSAGAFREDPLSGGRRPSDAQRYLRLHLAMATEPDTLSLQTTAGLRQPEEWPSSATDPTGDTSGGTVSSKRRSSKDPSGPSQ